jgi:hypothetical protein
MIICIFKNKDDIHNYTDYMGTKLVFYLEAFGGGN